MYCVRGKIAPQGADFTLGALLLGLFGLTLRTISARVGRGSFDGGMNGITLEHTHDPDHVVLRDTVLRRVFFGSRAVV